MDNVLIDIKQMEARRDKLYDGLSQQGYDISKPEGKCWLKDPFPRKVNSFSTLKLEVGSLTQCLKFHMKAVST